MLTTLFKAARRNPFKRGLSKYQSELETLLGRARAFAQQGNKDALEDLQRLVLRPLQSNHMVNAYLRPAHKALEFLDEWNDFGLTYVPGLNQSFIDFVVLSKIAFWRILGGL